jgi:hypothetical protein
MLEVIEKTGEDSNGDARYEVTVKRDGKKIKGFYAGSLYENPEDASLGRDLGYAYSAVDFLRLGYEAGKSGEEIVFVEEEMGEDD